MYGPGLPRAGYQRRDVVPVAPALWVDEFTRQHLAFRVERRMGAADVIETLDLAVLAHGAPQVLRADNGPEFIAGALGRWASEHDTLQAFIPPG